MRIDPQTASLFTDSGEFLKTLACPLQKRRDELRSTDAKFFCDSCYRQIHDTSRMTDDDLVRLLARDPQACLLVSSSQANCTVLPGTTKNRLPSS